MKAATLPISSANSGLMPALPASKFSFGVMPAFSVSFTGQPFASAFAPAGVPVHWSLQSGTRSLSLSSGQPAPEGDSP